MKYTKLLSFCLFCCALIGNLQAQSDNTTNPNTKDSTEIIILNINQMHGLKNERGETITELLGDVHLRQAETHFWCDTAFLQPNNQLEAYGNVQIAPQDSLRIFADTLYYNGLSKQATLQNNVILEDSTATILTRILHYDLNTKIATYPEQVLVMSDSTELISKSGYYDANTNIAYFIDSVRGVSGNFKLVADSLAFNTKTEVVQFISPTMAYDENKVIYCEDGYFDSQNKYGVFAKNAYYLNRENGKMEKATGDSIIYDGNTNMYYLVGNAQYTDGSQNVNADSIIYDKGLDQYYFRGNPKFKSADSTQKQEIDAGNSYFDKATGNMIFSSGVVVKNENQILTSDSLVYNKDSKTGIAIGNAEFRDTIENSILRGGVIDYNDSSKTVIAYEKPVFITVNDGDSTWVTADTFKSIEIPKPIVDSTLIDSTKNIDSLSAEKDSMNEQKPNSLPQKENTIDTLISDNLDSLMAQEDSMQKDSTVRYVYAYRDVRIYGKEVQGLADSMFYNGADSLATLYGSPVLWAQGTQFKGDTINMKMENGTLYKISMWDNAFIVQNKAGLYYDQIKGKTLHAYMKDGSIDYVDIFSNGEAIYYIQDNEEAFVGVNRVACTNMQIRFEEKQINTIKFYIEPTAVMSPMGQTDHDALRLKGFIWREVQRPKSVEEILLRAPLADWSLDEVNVKAQAILDKTKAAAASALAPNDNKAADKKELKK